MFLLVIFGNVHFLVLVLLYSPKSALKSGTPGDEYVLSSLPKQS